MRAASLLSEEKPMKNTQISEISWTHGTFNGWFNVKSVRRFFRDYVGGLVRLWRGRGFPMYTLDFAQKQKELWTLLEYDHSKLIADGVVKQTMHALGLAWSYFPHAWSVSSGENRTPLDVFNDDALLGKAILKRVIWGDVVKLGKYPDKSPAVGLSANSLRKGLRTLTGTQGVSNFRPTAAAAIYHELLPEQGGVTWDMSMGWGGRMLGALACEKVRKYIGCDPSTKTFEGLTKMKVELLPMARRMGRALEVELHQLGSEMMRPVLEPCSVDLAFTSPPYFSTERYSDEPTQSYIKFPDREAWLTGFMGTTLDNCEWCLKPGGLLAVNIAAVKGYPELARDFVALAESKGWRLVETLRLALSAMPGAKHKHDKFKYEPIFVFKRKSD